jgi:hypothetical protein
MTDTLALPRLLVEEEKQDLVAVLQKYNWTRCVNLTHRFKTDAGETFLELQNFIRRLNGITQTRTNYWFTITENRNMLSQSSGSEDEYIVPVHIHGVLDEVGDLTSEQISACWRTTPKAWMNPHTGKSEVRPFQLGFTLITEFNLDPHWHFYMANQTRKGWVFTNIPELKEGG